MPVYSCDAGNIASLFLFPDENNGILKKPETNYWLL